MPKATATTSAARWGRYRATATRACKRVRWAALTDAQTDCLFLNRLSSPTRTEREIAAAYGVSAPAVHKHVAAALRNVARAGLGPPVAPEPIAPRLCRHCPAPRTPCRECLEALMRRPPIESGGRKSASGAAADVGRETL